MEKQIHFKNKSKQRNFKKGTSFPYGRLRSSFPRPWNKRPSLIKLYKSAKHGCLFVVSEAVLSQPGLALCSVPLH